MAQVQYSGTGRRKNSVARVRLVPGTGKIVMNGKPAEEYIPFANLREVMVQPFAVDSPVKDLRDATGNKSTYTMSSNTAEIINDTQALKKATNSLASSVKGLTQEIIKNNEATEDHYTNLEMTLDRYYKYNDVFSSKYIYKIHILAGCITHHIFYKYNL